MKDSTKSIEERTEIIGDICDKCGSDERYVVEMNPSGWPVAVFTTALKYYAERWSCPDTYVIPNNKSQFSNQSILVVGPNTCLCQR